MLKRIVLVALFFAFSVTESQAVCKGGVINLIGEICWECMFPARIGGYSFGGDGSAAPGEMDTPACACPSQGGVTIGLSVAFWEHARLIETVKDPYCFPALGAGLGGSGSLSALMAGSHSSSAVNDSSSFASQQVHYYILPVWSLLNLFSDMPCIEKQAFDLASMTEPDKSWQDDTFAFLLNPEALLFGNPITQLSCMADSVGAATDKPLDPLFWCFGSWGSAYPLSGSSTLSNPTTYNAQLASRTIFKLGREGLLRDTAIDKCSANGIMSPIMAKTHYKLQIARPRRGNACVPVGQTDFYWGSAKNPAMGTTSNAPDNFLWIMMRARTCCVGYSVN